MTEFKRASCYPDSPLLRDIARELVRLYGEPLGLKHLNVDAILFVEDPFKQSKPEKVLAGEAKVFDVKELHPAIAERLDADFMVIYYKLNGMKLEPAKLHAYFLEALMRIDPMGGLRKPDVQTFYALARGLGPDWKRKQYVMDVRMGQLLRGALVQQTIEGMQRAVDRLGDRSKVEAVTITAGDHEVTLRPTGTEQGA